MIRIQGGTHFLLLRRVPEGGHTIHIYRQFHDVARHWDGGCRVSPVFPLDKSTYPQLDEAGQRWILFAGPCFPGDLNPHNLPSATFLSLGLYNVVLMSGSPEERQAARKVVADLGAQWEEWELDGSRLKSVIVGERNELAPLPTHLTQPLPQLPKAALATSREYIALIATVVARSRQYTPQNAEDTEQFDAILRRLVAEPDLEPIAKHGLLVNASAALSRYCSQTFSGVSPILETECHFWTHSLLGIGIASLAFQRYRRFIEGAIADAGLIGGLLALSGKSCGKKDLITLVSGDPFWSGGEVDMPVVEGRPGPSIPLITCFSARDGFRSTKLSVSAPLEIITSGNTTQWTPLTVTHELSHTIIDGVLGVLLPSLNNPDELLRLARLVATPHSKIDTMLNQVRQMLCFAFQKIAAEPGAVSFMAGDPEDLRQAIKQHYTDVNEVLTHVFDFLYFYNCDAVLYIRSVWASWGVVPNIQNRVSSYITRCLCALSATNLRKSGALQVTVDQLITQLRATSAEFPGDLIKAAIEELVSRREYYLLELDRRLLLPKFVRAFLYRESVVESLVKDDIAVTGDRGGYPFVHGEFGSERVQNPLRFAAAYSADKEPDNKRAIWMLYMLAFEPK